MVPPLVPQHREVGQGRLGARENNRIRLSRNWLAGGNETDFHIRLGAQRIEIVEVADPRQHRHGNKNGTAFQSGLVQHDSVFCGQPRGTLQPWHDAEAAPAATVFDEAHAICKKGLITPKAIDDEACDHLGIICLDDGSGAHKRCDDPATIDIADQHYGNVGSAREAHIGDVALAQVHLGRAPRALDYDEVVRRFQAVECLDHRGKQASPIGHIGRRFLAAQGFPIKHDLRTPIAFRLEEHGIHISRWIEACCSCLQGLRPTDLAATGAGCGIVRHILRLERSDPDPPARCDPA